MTVGARVRRRAAGGANPLRMAIVIACALAGPSAALAQGADEVSTARALLSGRVSQQAPTNPAPVFITEWAGGTLGSMAGLGLGLAIAVLEEASPGTTDGVLGIATISLTQGLLSALGSRMGRAIVGGE